MKLKSRTSSLVVVGVVGLLSPFALHALAQDHAPNKREITLTARNYRFNPARIEVSQDDLVKLTVQSEDNGQVNVASADGESAAKAIGIIQELTATPELNKTYMGKVQRITDFGAFVEIMAGTDGLLHVSEIANHRVKDVRDELKEGQQILVKVINIDPTGKIRLSRKALLQDEPQKDGAPAPAAKE